MNMESETKDKRKSITPSNKTKMLRSLIILAAIAALIAGLTYAWFFNQMDMATLMKIQQPSDISILGPNGTQLDYLELSGEANKKGGKVTIKRVFCVQSKNDFNLEIVHTTNLEGLEFKLYRAKEVDSNTDSSSENTEKVTESGCTYSYAPQKALDGGYINTITDENTNNYKYAKEDYHSTNYGDYKNVQSHAEPIYWLVGGAENNYKLNCDESNPIEITDKSSKETYYRTYFVCEISWTESTKETDIFYILAQDAS